MSTFLCQTTFKCSSSGFRKGCQLCQQLEMSGDNCPGGAWQDSSVAPEAFPSPRQSRVEHRPTLKDMGRVGLTHGSTTGTEGTFCRV